MKAKILRKINHEILELNFNLFKVLYIFQISPNRHFLTIKVLATDIYFLALEKSQIFLYKIVFSKNTT